MAEETTTDKTIAERSDKGGSASKFAVIVAAGSGTRAGGGLPKQFHRLAGVPLLWHSVRAFLRTDPSTLVILVLSESGMEIWRELRDSLPVADRKSAHEKVLMVRGGATRTESVTKALEALSGIAKEGDRIAIHDGARPMVTPELISRGWRTLDDHKAAIPVVPLTDSIRSVTADGSAAEDRTRFKAVQTPQFFEWRTLKESYDGMRPDVSYTDDASVVEERCPIKLFDGDPLNMKVTQPHDFAVAEVLMASEATGKNA